MQDAPLLGRRSGRPPGVDAAALHLDGGTVDLQTFWAGPSTSPYPPSGLSATGALAITIQP